MCNIAIMSGPPSLFGDGTREPPLITWFDLCIQGGSDHVATFFLLRALDPSPESSLFLSLFSQTCTLITLIPFVPGNSMPITYSESLQIVLLNIFGFFSLKTLFTVSKRLDSSSQILLYDYEYAHTS